MAVNDVYQVDLLFTVKGEKCANVFHIQETVDPGADNEALAAKAVQDDIWTAAMQATASNDATLQTIRVRKVSPAAGGPIIFPVDQAGTVAQDVLPPNNTAVITFYTNRTDRSGRGRIHLVGVPKTHNQDGLLPATVTSLYEAVATAMEGNIAEAGGTWICGVWSRTVPQFNQFKFHQLRSWIHTLRGRRMVSP